MGNIEFLGILWLGLGFITGTVLGSFIKVLADRSLGNKTFLGRSYCVHCKHKLAWYDLFPLVSFLTLRGKCRYCGAKISKEYLTVEVVMGLLIMFLFWQAFPAFELSILIFNVFFISVLAVLFITDLKQMFIPDRITYPALVITFAYRALFATNSLLEAIIMATGIGGFFIFLIIITKGRGMGGGDVKLGALMGLVLGFPLSIVALMISFMTGGIFAINLIILGKKSFGQTIPFGPFLVSGSLIALFWGNEIMEWYLRLSI